MKLENSTLNSAFYLTGFAYFQLKFSNFSRDLS